MPISSMAAIHGSEKMLSMVLSKNMPMTAAGTVPSTSSQMMRRAPGSVRKWTRLIRSLR